jgi:enterochelin esterase-like enzyme
LPSQSAEPQTAIPAVTRQSTIERWQNVVEYSFYSPSRQQEILFTIYTPPGYEQSDERYPVLYFLHGSQGSHILFWNAISREVTAANEDAGGWISDLIESGQIPPLIIVAPNDSDGGWGDTNETMVTQELIQAIDGNWRTIANKNGRSLAGFSMGSAGAARYPAQNPELYCNTMLLAESHVDEAATLWAQNRDAILASGLQVGLVVGELDTRGVSATTAVVQILTELNIPHELKIVPDVPHNFGQLYNQIGVWALQFHAACWQNAGG